MQSLKKLIALLAFVLVASSALFFYRGIIFFYYFATPQIVDNTRLAETEIQNIIWETDQTEGKVYYYYPEIKNHASTVLIIIPGMVQGGLANPAIVKTRNAALDSGKIVVIPFIPELFDFVLSPAIETKVGQTIALIKTKNSNKRIGLVTACMGSFFTLKALEINTLVPDFVLLHSSFGNIRLLAQHLSRPIPHAMAAINASTPPLAEPYGKIILIINSPKIFENPLKVRQVLLNYLKSTKDTYDWVDFFSAIEPLSQLDQKIILGKLDPGLLPLDIYSPVVFKNKISTNMYLSHNYQDHLVPIAYGNELAKLLKGKTENLYFHVTGMEHDGGAPPGQLAKIIAIIESSFFLIDFGNN